MRTIYQLKLAYNDDLTDVDALGGVTSIYKIYIGYNSALPTADAEALVSAISSGATSATVEHNGP